MKRTLKLMRVHHYIKNVLILLPIIFSGRLFETSLLIKTGLGFIAFCLISSVIYIINDIQDVENDRQHPTKKFRPIASEQISVRSSWILAVILFIIALIFNYLSCGFNIMAWIFIFLYLILNLAYSLGLKDIPILDIAILVSGFFLRVLYGSAITDIVVSKWLYLTVISLCFYLALGKRRNEFLKKGYARKVLQYYNQNFLDKNMYMFLALSIVFYSLWCVDPLTIARHSNPNIVWTVPLVMLMGMKYSLNIEGTTDGDPVEIILKDKILIALGLLYCIIAMFLLY